jgi:hypothetical protein
MEPTETTANEIDFTPVLEKLDVIILNQQQLKGWLILIFIILSITAGIYLGYLVGRKE